MWASPRTSITRRKNRLNLRFADRDAEELYQLLRTPAGGAFDDSRILKLINEQATHANIRYALYSFLKKPAREDLVLIYFVCHGAPDPDRPQLIYLMTYDADPNNIAGTALPMDELDKALSRILLAERVVVIADTCHSAALGGGIGGRAVDDATVVNAYMRNLGQSKAGVALLTSAEANEVSLEDEKWGGGHGLFTYHLLEGMRGKADKDPADGTVTVGELFDYVRDRVIDTAQQEGRSQHPVIGPNVFDRTLPMAEIGHISAEGYYELGCALYQLGWLLNDPQRFAAAGRQLQAAIRLFERMRVPAPEAQLQLGLACQAMRDLANARRAFEAALRQDNANKLAAAHLYTGIASLHQNDLVQASKSLQSFIKAQPDHALVEWTKAVLVGLSAARHTPDAALLIGVSAYPDPMQPLRGPTNDVAAMHSLLVEHLGFTETSITQLTDAAATRTGILSVLEALRQRTSREDTVLVYFSGHSVEEGGQGWLVPYDYQPNAAAASQAITAQELHDRLNAIPTPHKLLLIDSNISSSFLDVAQRGGTYGLFLAAHPQQAAFEHLFAGRTLGRFTYVLTQEVRRMPVNATLGEIAERVTTAMARIDPHQVPVFVGDQRQPITHRKDLRQQLALFEFSLRRNFAAYSLEDIERYDQEAQRSFGAPFQQFYCSLDRAYLEKRAYARAEAVLQMALQQAQEYDDALLAIGVAQLRQQKYVDAVRSFQSYRRATQPPDHMEESLRLTSALQRSRKHALLVGINRYADKSLARLRGAVNDVRALKAALVASCGFLEEDITELTDEDANSEALERRFAELVEQAKHEPAIFYFAGYGSTDAAGEPTLVPYDGRTRQSPNDLHLRDLAARVRASPTNLITVIDAGWAPSVALPLGSLWGGRYAAPDLRPAPGTRALRLTQQASDGSGVTIATGEEQRGEEWRRTPARLWQPDTPWLDERRRVESGLRDFQIGRVSIDHVSIQAVLGGQANVGGEATVEAEVETNDGAAVYGLLTQTLIRSLPDMGSNITYAQLADRVTNQLQWLKPYYLGDNLDEALFSAPVQERQIQELIERKIYQRPLHQAKRLLKLLIERHNSVHAEAHLNLGIVHAALGEYKDSRAELERAIEQFDNAVPAEAHYQLGRVIFEMDGELDQSITELQRARALEPENLPLHYYLGQAIHKRIERQTLREAHDALQKYLDGGAPLGRRTEVEALLRTMVLQ